MQVRTIIAPIRTVEAAPRQLKIAIDLARRHDAHLIGLHVAERITVYSDYAMLAAVPDVANLQAAQAERAGEIEKIFKQMTDPEAFVSEWRFDLAEAQGASDHIIDQARVADLVVAAQEDPEAESYGRDRDLQRVIRECGRPVLVVPYAGAFETVGARTLIGWSATREAARAVHDAVPLVKPGAVATILVACSADEAGGPVTQSAKDLAVMLDRHGVKAEVREHIFDHMAIGDVLLNEAFEHGADLLVTGAFGHSALYDFVIGAVTTRLLESMTMPVLFSS